MKLYSFDRFKGELINEFDQTKHYQQRINIVPFKEETKRNKFSGSRLLPREISLGEKGYNIDFLRNADNKEEVLSYKEWLGDNNTNRRDFESFVSSVWHYQATHPKVLDKEFGIDGKYYGLLTGEINFKTKGDKIWAPIFYTDKGIHQGKQFLINAVGNDLTTLFTYSEQTEIETRNKIHTHFSRLDPSFKKKYPIASDFVIGRDFMLKELNTTGEPIVVEFFGEEDDLERAKERIDIAYKAGPGYQPTKRVAVGDYEDDGKSNIHQYSLAKGNKLKVKFGYKEDYEIVTINDILNRDKNGYQSGGVKLGVTMIEDDDKKAMKTMKPGEIFFVPGKTEDEWLKAEVVEPGYIVDTRQKEPLNLKYKLR